MRQMTPASIADSDAFADGRGTTSAINSRSLASAIVCVSPSRLPGGRTFPSLRNTWRSPTRHLP
jgi:hypothetical protein